MYDIEWINHVAPISGLDFTEVHGDQLADAEVEDIGGLEVYLRHGNVVAVFDYENDCGWFAP
jgi:hypothetical protein